MSEVQGHIAARSFHPSIDRSPLKLTAIHSRPDSDKSQVSLPSYRSHHISIENLQLQDEKQILPVISPDPGSSSGLSTDSALEAIQNMNRLQKKVMSLQGEALRVTYAIDQVNQCMIEWHQNKEDLKHAVQRRSEQFQFFIKRMEHQLLAKIDGKQADDKFYDECDKSKDELRTLLKNILHEVNVLKSVQELGKDAEIIALSSSLLGKSVNMVDVSLHEQHFDISYPTKPIEEVVSMYFGDVILQVKENNVYVPQILDFSEVSAGNTTESQAGDDSTDHRKNIETPVMGDKEIDKAAAAGRRRLTDRTRKYNTDLGLEKPDVKEFLAQMQSVRETFRARRREILAQGQRAREETSPSRDEFYRRPRSTSRKGRVQSLDRVDTPVNVKAGAVLPNSSVVHDGKTTGAMKMKYVSHDHVQDLSNPAHESPFMHQFREQSGNSAVVSADETGLSPAPGFVPVPSQFQRKLVKQYSDPRYSHNMPLHPEETLHPDVPSSDNSKILIEQLRSRRLSNPIRGFSMERRHSEQLTSVSLGEPAAFDFLKHDQLTSRPVRRAISNVADRKTKIEFLRGNWQRRKEILIQNEGFVCPDSPPKHEPVTQLPAHGTSLTSNTFETKDHPASSPTPSDDPRVESMHQIKNRVEQYRNELTKMDHMRQNEEKLSPVTFPSARVSEKPSSNFQKKEDAPRAEMAPALSEIVSPTDEQNTTSPTELTGIQQKQTSPEQQVQAATVTTAQVQAVHSAVAAAAAAPVHTVQAVSEAVSTQQINTTAITAFAQPVQPGKTTATTTTTAPEQPAQTATLSSTETSIGRSRYTRCHAQPRESIDIASLIAAMYSGNEKSLLRDNKPDSVSSNTSATKTQDGSNTTTTTARTTSISTTTAATTDTTTTTTATTTITSSIITAAVLPMNSTAITPTTTKSRQAVEANITAATSSESQASTAAPITSKQIENQTSSVSIDQTVRSSTSVTDETLPKREPKRYRYAASSRYTDGVNRRHTVQVDKAELENALKMLSSNQHLLSQDTALKPIPESPTLNQTPLYIPQRNMLTDSSRKLEFGNGTERKESSLAESPESNETREATIPYKIKAAGIITKITSPLEVIEEKSHSPHSPSAIAAAAAAAALAAASGIPSPTSRNETDTQKLKLREIARKKKERWRHLTIH